MFGFLMCSLCENFLSGAAKRCSCRVKNGKLRSENGVDKLPRAGYNILMKGLIVINAYWRAECVTEQAERIKEELEKAGAEAEVRRNGFLPCSAGGGIVSEVAGSCDFCVYLDKDKYLSALLEAGGMRLFDTHAAIALCDDKMATYTELARRGIPVPRTVPAPLCYTPGSVPSADMLDKAERLFGYPMVVKTSCGSGGKGVYKADCRAELEDIERRLLFSPHMFQEYIRPSEGRDVRVITIGGKVLGAMLRRAPEGEFRSNIAAGGSGTPFELDDAGRELCERVSSVVGADYAGIDLLFGEDGYVVCEVNSNAFFGGFERACGVNVAKAYAEHIVRTMGGKA